MVYTSPIVLCLKKKKIHFSFFYVSVCLSVSCIDTGDLTECHEGGHHSVCGEHIREVFGHTPPSDTAGEWAHCTGGSVGVYTSKMDCFVCVCVCVCV